ncbi:hypothetical protein DFH08DRAFT_825435 [Mycena albidolilacea]|uniref:Uncharacterized protein n=1 Tax=Mycena albidolilacea TaxID=1033008 RepID=A0AAD7EA85_9AGAR|nr:hypothetical protein DFH08DRAFT_825435 [Mycena albidolilacea]
MASRPKPAPRLLGTPGHTWTLADPAEVCSRGLYWSQVLRKVAIEGHSPLRDTAHLERGGARWFEAASHAPRHLWAQPCRADPGQTLPRRLDQSRLRLSKAGFTWLQEPSKCTHCAKDLCFSSLVYPAAAIAVPQTPSLCQMALRKNFLAIHILVDQGT